MNSAREEARRRAEKQQQAALWALKDAGLVFTEVVADGTFHRAPRPHSG